MENKNEYNVEEIITPTRKKKKVREPEKPGKFAVALHNDDFTPMEFVEIGRAHV